MKSMLPSISFPVVWNAKVSKHGHKLSLLFFICFDMLVPGNGQLPAGLVLWVTQSPDSHLTAIRLCANIPKNTPDMPVSFLSLVFLLLASSLFLSTWAIISGNWSLVEFLVWALKVKASKLHPLRVSKWLARVYQASGDLRNASPTRPASGLHSATDSGKSSACNSGSHWGVLYLSRGTGQWKSAGIFGCSQRSREIQEGVPGS